MKESINNYLEKLKTTIDNLDKNEIEIFINLLLNARKSNNTIFIMGNGGSASTANHFLCDIAKGTSCGDYKRFKIVSLNDNIPIMMAYANDVGYEDIFVEQLKNQLQKDDLVIGISGSGNSKNVLKAIDYANKNGAVTVGVTGYSGGILKGLCTHSVNAKVDDMQISEDIHMILVHLCMQIINTKSEELLSKKL